MLPPFTDNDLKMPRKESILKLKTEAFAFRIIKLYKFLVKQNESVISKQIYRSGTSIGANIAESKNAQSPADFLNKLNIALKEANETEYWLKLLLLSDYVKEAKKILDKWNYLFGSDLNSLIHSDVVRLECLAQFC